MKQHFQHSRTELPNGNGREQNTMARKTTRTTEPRTKDVCPQCGRENVRTYREIARNYVCYGCTRFNES